MPIIPKLDGHTPIEDILESFRKIYEDKKETKADLKSKEKQNKKS